MTIHVGCTGMPLTRAQYFEVLSSVEVVPAQEVPMRPASAHRMAEEAPQGFVFSMVASRILTFPPDTLPPGLSGDPKRYGGLQLTPESSALYERTLDAATALGARTVVFITPPQIGPGRRGKETLGQFFGRVDRRGLRFAWEPHGPWVDDEIAAVCAEQNLIRCFDPLRDRAGPGDVAYARLGPFAALGRSLADDELERIVEVLEGYEDAFCFFATDRAFSDARRMRALVES
jgi:uncharacterized protein YecE (DUF72 family)